MDINESKRVYISADYDEENGDRDVVDELHKWAEDNRYKVNYVDTAQVVSGSVSKDQDCRPCDLKNEFNKQINISSIVIFIIGDKTRTRTAGNLCRRVKDGEHCDCTPYKQNSLGTSKCKFDKTSKPYDNIGYINEFSYLQHEFYQAKKREKDIIIIYNSLNNQPSWLPAYMKEYESEAFPFWINKGESKNVGNYQRIKKALGYD
ncbi:Uncharacterised protein [Anaerobiospirillum thomasii]|uniref:hypothetical protein n=1 Tax=Anaerobiospirillum thomasii TaxID=179995 RepID=UPI000D88767A|nr:hypothetical protein [Anaerobiospirillum thomasii]SPT68335.1 Uncharacterised protein [Anaerobiospirillum thomasii]